MNTSPPDHPSAASAPHPTSEPGFASFFLSSLQSRRERSAFSLIELIVVIAVIAILTALVGPAVSNFGRSTALMSSGNMVTNLAGFARQTAMSKNTLTALVMLTDAGLEEDYRVLTVLEYVTGGEQQTGGWAQISKWETLPTGIVVDPTDATNSTFLVNSPQPFPYKLDIKYKTAALKDHYAARIFLPNGSLQNADKAAQLRLVEGFRQGDVMTYTRPGTGGRPANYYDVAILGATGIVKVSRP